MRTLARFHARLLRNAAAARVTVEDLARAWASIDGKGTTFVEERDDPMVESPYGHYLGYITEAEEMLRRATHYACNRNGTENAMAGNIKGYVVKDGKVRKAKPKTNVSKRVKIAKAAKTKQGKVASRAKAMTGRRVKPGEKQ